MSRPWLISIRPGAGREWSSRDRLQSRDRRDRDAVRIVFDRVSDTYAVPRAAVNDISIPARSTAEQNSGTNM